MYGPVCRACRLRDNPAVSDGYLDVGMAFLIVLCEATRGRDLHCRFLHVASCSPYLTHTGKTEAYESAHSRALEYILSEGEACFCYSTMSDNRAITTAHLGMSISQAFLDFSPFFLLNWKIPAVPLFPAR